MTETPHENGSLTYAEARQIAANIVSRCPLPRLTGAQRGNLEVQIATELLNAGSRRDSATS